MTSSPLLRWGTRSPGAAGQQRRCDGMLYCIVVVVSRRRRNLLIGDDYYANEERNKNFNWYHHTGLFLPWQRTLSIQGTIATGTRKFWWSSGIGRGA
jgi:hypothetical protein